MSEKVIKKIYRAAYDEIELTEEYKKILERADNEYNRVAKSLSKEQLEDFEKFDDTTLELSSETARIYFEYGFKLGLRLIAECFICDEGAEN